MNTICQEYDDEIINTLMESILVEAGRSYNVDDDDDFDVNRLNRFSARGSFENARDIAARHDMRSVNPKNNQSTDNIPPEDDNWPSNLGGRTERFLQEAGKRKLTRDEIKQLNAIAKRLAQEKNVSPQEALKMLRRYGNFSVDIFVQTEAEETAQDNAETKIAEKLGLEKGDVSVAIGRIPTADSLWYSMAGVYQLQAADGNAVAASDRMSYTLGDYANCVQVTIDWGSKSAWEAIKQWRSEIRGMGLELPGIGTATQDKAAYWGEVILWHLRDVIWGMIKDDMAEAGFNVDTDIIPAVRATNDISHNIEVEDLRNFLRTGLGIKNLDKDGFVKKEKRYSSGLSQLRFAINQTKHRTDDLNTRIEERAKASVRGVIGAAAQEFLVSSGLLRDIFNSWVTGTRRESGFSECGGFYFDLLKALSKNELFREINVWDMSGLPTAESVEKSKPNSKQRRNLTAPYNHVAGSNEQLDANVVNNIVSKKIMPLFWAALDNTKEVSQKMIEELSGRRASQPSAKMEFTNQPPHWEVQEHNRAAESTTNRMYNQETPYAKVQRGDGTVERVHPYYGTNQFGVRPDIQTKFNLARNLNEPSSPTISSTETAAAKQLAQLARNKLSL